MKRIVCLFAVLMLITAGVFAGGRARDDRYLVGFISPNINDLFQIFIMEAFTGFFADRPDFNVVVQDSQENILMQQDQVNALIAQGARALVVVPVDTGAMAPIIAAAASANVPLVFVNRNPFGDAAPPTNAFYVGSQEIVAGRLQGEAMAQLLNGQGGVAILMGILGNEGAIMRTQGNEEVLARFPGITILDRQTGNWQPDLGLNHTQNWITAFGPQLNGILSNNDEMALGAIQALSAAGRSDVAVIGVDAVPDALAAVRGGTMSGTVFQDAVGQGRGAAEKAYQAIRGGTPASLTWVPFVYIDRSNIDQF